MFCLNFYSFHSLEVPLGNFSAEYFPILLGFTPFFISGIYTTISGGDKLNQIIFIWVTLFVAIVSFMVSKQSVSLILP